MPGEFFQLPPSKFFVLSSADFVAADFSADLVSVDPVFADSAADPDFAFADLCFDLYSDRSFVSVADSGFDCSADSMHNKDCI